MIIKKAMSGLLLVSCILMQAVTLNEIMPPSAESAYRVMQKVQEVSQTDKMKKMELERQEKIQAAMEEYAVELAEDVVRELQPEDARSLDQIMTQALVFIDDVRERPDELTVEEQILMVCRWMDLMSLINPYKSALAKRRQGLSKDQELVLLAHEKAGERIALASLHSLISKVKSFVERAANR